MREGNGTHVDPALLNCFLVLENICAVLEVPGTATDLTP